MSRLRVHNLAVSLDGCLAGPEQSLEHPLGRGGERLHDWAVATRTFRATHGMEGGATGLDDDMAAAGDTGIGATIMGRNMFGPIRGQRGTRIGTDGGAPTPRFTIRCSSSPTIATRS